MSDSTPTLERVARAICKASVLLVGWPEEEAAKYYDEHWPEYTKAARAALDASGNDELVEALKDARAWIADDPEMGPREAQVHRKVLARIDAAIARAQEKPRHD